MHYGATPWDLYGDCSVTTNIKVDFTALEHSINLKRAALTNAVLKSRLQRVAEEYSAVLEKKIAAKVDPVRSTGTMATILTEVISPWKTPRGWAVGVGDLTRLGSPAVLPPDAQNTIGRFLKWVNKGVEEKDAEVMAAQEIVMEEVRAKAAHIRERVAEARKRAARVAKARVKKVKAQKEALAKTKAAYEKTQAIEREVLRRQAEVRAGALRLQKRLHEFRAVPQSDRQATARLTVERHRAKLVTINQRIRDAQVHRAKLEVAFGPMQGILLEGYNRRLAALKEQRRAIYRTLRLARQTMREGGT